ncbi:hypothetical protein N7471_010580 [Penicillium samsonianum]|uniref:uncharacterized protein n=1 Tax=Penicillium samsonianum TaxID=1882272 RepID=UPI0025491261|nr:uncharacterized protein N7471_010580 [Penicillium samsonianum]KAJ6126087.1 hypothetical protein N7471_010580 [Penicillium samsonianum]
MKDQSLAQDINLHDPTIGVHHYDSRQLRTDDEHYNPPHVDSGWLTVLLREPTGCCDGLEIADLESTESTESKEVGENATFCPVSTMPGEAVVIAGLKQYLLRND